MIPASAAAIIAPSRSVYPAILFLVRLLRYQSRLDFAWVVTYPYTDRGDSQASCGSQESAGSSPGLKSSDAIVTSYTERN